VPRTRQSPGGRDRRRGTVWELVGGIRSTGRRHHSPTGGSNRGRAHNRRYGIPHGRLHHLGNARASFKPSPVVIVGEKHFSTLISNAVLSHGELSTGYLPSFTPVLGVPDVAELEKPEARAGNGRERLGVVRTSIHLATMASRCDDYFSQTGPSQVTGVDQIRTPALLRTWNSLFGKGIRVSEESLSDDRSPIRTWTSIGIPTHPS